MHRAVLLLLVALCAVLPRAAQRPSEPFVPLGVSYGLPLAADRERMRAELEVIRSLGFNAVLAVVEWREVEAARREYRFDALDALFEAARAADLRVALRIGTASAPEWVLARYPDGRFVPPSPSAGVSGAQHVCLDHGGVRADALAFVKVLTAHVSNRAALQSVDVGSDLPMGLCVCPHTRARLQEWTKTGGSGLADSSGFLASKLRDDLTLLVEATALQPARMTTSHAPLPTVLRRPPSDAAPSQDDWSMRDVVTRYGTSLMQNATSAEPLTPAERALGLDGLRSAARERGWSLSNGGDARDAASLRVLAWSAWARGARSLFFGEWRAPGSDRVTLALVAADGTMSDRARAASALATVIARNPALFEPLRPRPAQAAIVFEPGRVASSEREADALVRAYKALFDRNIQADVLRTDEVPARRGNYRLVLEASPSQSDDRIGELITRSGVVPEVRLDGGAGTVETRFLESPDVLVLIGLNHGDTPQRVKMTFPPDTQEAIWQNMETGTGVNFVAGAGGPTYTYAFRPRDALVLMIRKGIR